MVQQHPMVRITARPRTIGVEEGGRGRKKPAANLSLKNAIVPVLPRVVPLKLDPRRAADDTAHGKADQRLYDQAAAILQTIVRDHATSPAAPGACAAGQDPGAAGTVRGCDRDGDGAQVKFLRMPPRRRVRSCWVSGSNEQGRESCRGRARRARRRASQVSGQPVGAWSPRGQSAPRDARACEGHGSHVRECSGAVRHQPADRAEIPDVRGGGAGAVPWARRYNRKRYDLAVKAFSDLAAHFPETRYEAWWRAAELYESV